MAGLGGAYYLAGRRRRCGRSELTAGRGWIALALVVFAAWRPWRLLLGAYLFGAVMTFELQAKAAGLTWRSPPEFLAMRCPILRRSSFSTLISLGRRPAGCCSAGLPRQTLLGVLTA